MELSSGELDTLVQHQVLARVRTIALFVASRVLNSGLYSISTVSSDAHVMARLFYILISDFIFSC